MGRIQTNIGLMTGLPIADIVKQLMEVSGRPRDNLVQRTDKLREQQNAFNELAARLLSIRYVANEFGKAEVFDSKEAVSSHPEALSARVTGDPPRGSFLFTPVRQVQNHQLLSAGVASESEPLGGGTFSFRFGAHVARSAAPETFNGGEGIARGRIRITDRSGARAEVDLSTARTVNDVIEAVNSTAGINVTLEAHGDGFRLVDHTGQSVSNLMVQEVGAGTTAASLGMDGINTGEVAAVGRDLIHLFDDLDLIHLNDGAGMTVNAALPDLMITFRDGTQGTVDLSPIEEGTNTVIRERTLGEVLDRINTQLSGKARAEIAPDGDRLVVTDLTGGTGTFRIESAHGGRTAEDLGIAGESSGDAITGRRLLGGLQSVLLSSLNGGRGWGPLGSLELTDRDGGFAEVDLSAAETLEGVIRAINDAGIGITARVNSARNGIELVDASGGTGNLIVAGEAAEKLGIAVDAAVNAANSGNMHLKVVSHNTRLADLNGGRGVVRGKFAVYDSAGNGGTVDLTQSAIQTVGDVIREIERLPGQFSATISETGDGITISDLADGGGKLRVQESGGTTARDLGLAREAETVDIGNGPQQAIRGSLTHTITLDEGDSLDDLRQKINEVGGGLSATILLDGSARPHRLALVSEQAGARGELVIDDSQIGISVTETVRPRDAMLLLGRREDAAGSVLASSPTNSFSGVLPGVTLDVRQPSAQPVGVTVSRTDSKVVSTATAFVENFNAFRAHQKELTAFDAETGEGSLLTGNAAALRMETDLANLLSGRVFGAGSIQSLGEVGIRLKDDGSLELDEGRLKERFAEDPEAVRDFFTTETHGVAPRLKAAIDRLAGEDDSLLTTRFRTLQDQIESNEQRIEHWNSRLEREQERLLMHFYQMETSIAKLQGNLSALEAIQPLPPLVSLRGGD